MRAAMAGLRLSFTASLSTCDANHEALITGVVVAMAREFGVRSYELHADTTSVSFSGGRSRIWARNSRSSRRLRGMTVTARVTSGSGPAAVARGPAA